VINVADLTWKLLVAEHNRTEEEAKALVKKHTNIMMQAIMSGATMLNVRAAALAIEMKESEERHAT
jgi:hypothetical protein